MMDIIATTENSTFAGNSSLLENSTVGNSTLSDDNIYVQLGVPGIIVVIFYSSAYVLSISTMIIHLFKFFTSKQTQNLQIKNLTTYCTCLLIMYLYLILSTTNIPIYYPTPYDLVDLYIHIVASVLIVVMSFYTCMCIIVSQKGYHIPYTDEKQFLIYFVIGWVLPIPLSMIVFIFERSLFWRITTILFIRFIAVIPFFVSLWYIRSIGWNTTNVIKNFVIHLRLLILTGVISFIPNSIYGVLLFLDEQALSTKFFAFISETLYLWEGFIVGLCFTYRKGTFENRNENPIEMTNGYNTEVAQVVDGDAVAS